MEENYFKERAYLSNNKSKALLSELPSFVEEFYIGIEQKTSPLTRLNYLTDLKIFFNFLVTEVTEYKNLKSTELSISDMNNIKAFHIEKFLSYLTNYNYDEKMFSNDERGKSRKLSTLRSMFKYFFNKDKLSSNIASKIEMPKIHDKSIVKLEIDEVVKIINAAETGENLTKQQKAFNLHTNIRDVAILSLLLGTGMRVSECVGINKNDLDFEVNGVKITRKGGNQTVLYFGDEVKTSLVNYLNYRSELNVENEQALFISLQNNRLGVRSIEKLVKKYAAVSAPLKKISPHKLRSTFGTNLYRETKDIYVVADILGHKDVNTTKKHYTAISEDMRRNVANVVKLRNE